MAAKKPQYGHLVGTPKYSPGVVPKGVNRPFAPAPSPGAASPAPAPSQPDPGGLPLDPNLEAQRAAAERSLRLGDAADTYQTGRVNTNYGFDANGGIDPNNPYSQAALMQKRYQEQKLGNTNSYAAQGQLYSGSLINAQNSANSGFDQGIDQLKKQRQDALAEILLGKVGRYSQNGNAVDQAQMDAIIKALGG